MAAEGNTTEAIDTLKEIQDFLTSDDGTVKTLLDDVAANKSAIEKEVEDREAADDALQAKIDEINKSLTEGSVFDAIESARNIGESAQEAAGDAQEAADAAQADVNALEKIVGSGFNDNSTVALQLAAVKATADNAIQETEGEYLYKNNDKSINIKVCSDFSGDSLTEDSYQAADAYAIKEYVDDAVAPLAKNADVVKTVTIATDCADFAKAVKTNNNVEFTFYYGGDDAE